jgi:hypothetical protein
MSMVKPACRQEWRGRLLRRSALVASMAAILPNTACYTYRAASSEQIVPGTRVAFGLTDQARVDLSEQIGAGALRVDGTLAEATDNSYLLRVSAVRSIQGGSSRWTGEPIRFSQEHVATVMRRDFSRSRTIVAVAAVSAAVAAFIVTRDLNVFGLGRDDRNPRPPLPDQ